MSVQSAVKSLHRNEEFQMYEIPSEDKCQRHSLDATTNTTRYSVNSYQEEEAPKATPSPTKTRNEEPTVIFVSGTCKSPNLLSAVPHQSKYFREIVPVEVLRGPPTLLSETITGHKSLRLRLRDLEKSNTNYDQILLLFIGTPDKNGRSWHAESNTAERAVSFMVKKLRIGGYFLKIHVGNRMEWMDPDNAFKKDHKIELTNIPSLLVWDSLKRISGKRCADVESLYVMLKD